MAPGPFSPACMMAAVSPAGAADYPDKPIKIVVAYPAGGATDVWGKTIRDANIRAE